MIVTTITAVVLTMTVFTRPVAGGPYVTEYKEFGPYMSMQACMDAMDSKFDSGVQGFAKCKWRTYSRTRK